MSCYSCSHSAVTCNKASFSIQQPAPCPLTSLTPAIPAHYFNLFCNYHCEPIVCPTPSPNHGIGCNAYNGYHPITCVKVPGHMVSCPGCVQQCPQSTCHK